MKAHPKGFSIVQLMIALVLTSILIMGIYQYFIKGTEQMTNAIRLSALENNTYRAFRSVVSDLKLIGYNPLGQFNAGIPFYGLRDPLAERPGNLSYIHYSFYNKDPNCTALGHDPACPDDSGNNGINCYCDRFLVDQNTLRKEYFSIANDQVENLLLATNVCTRFVFWDTVNNQACDCQDGKKCTDTDPTGNNPCPDLTDDLPPEAVKFVLASVPDSRYLSDFTDSPTFCSIPSSVLGPSEYIRFEKVVFLSNLR